MPKAVFFSNFLKTESVVHSNSVVYRKIMAYSFLSVPFKMISRLSFGGGLLTIKREIMV